MDLTDFCVKTKSEKKTKKKEGRNMGDGTLLAYSAFAEVPRSLSLSLSHRHTYTHTHTHTHIHTHTCTHTHTHTHTHKKKHTHKHFSERRR